MTTFDQTNGLVAGLQASGIQFAGVNTFELDFEEAIASHPTLAAADIITIGKIKAGSTILPGFAETVVASTTASAADLDIQDGSAAKIITGLGIDTAAEVKACSIAASAYFGQTTSHPIQLTSDLTINVLVGATLPTNGKIRVSFPVFKGAKF